MDIRESLSAILWGGFFIALGVVWLLQSLGIININIWDWWPVIFIVIGITIIVSEVGKQK